VKAKNLAELKKIYAEELTRKDKIIEDLKKENLILMRTAIKKHKEKI
jgi:hypothetical protein